MPADGDCSRNTGVVAREPCTGTGSGSDTDIINGMSPLTDVSGRLLAGRGDTVDGLRSEVTGLLNACCAGMSLACSDNVGVE